MKQNTGAFPEVISLRITALRFLLSVLVVFSHNNYTSEMIAGAVNKGGISYIFCPNKFTIWLQYIISNGFASCSVPIFFLFAAYLQSRKNDSYGTLLRKRAKSLLLPYFLWIGIYLIYQIFGKLIIAKLFPSILAHPGITVSTWGIKNWISYIWGYGKYMGLDEIGCNPVAAEQFWFVRDLMILVLISPILRYFMKVIPICFFISLTILYLVEIPVYFVSTSALFYYSVGLYWGIFNLQLLENIDRVSWIEMVVGYIFILVVGRVFITELIFVNEIKILISCIFFLKFSTLILKNEKCFSSAKYFASFSFFLYAVHMPAMLLLFQTIWLRFFPMKNAFFCIFEYFGVTIITIIIGTSIGIILKKKCPSLFSLLNGGR
ncbi:acyltransferase family protein [Treponema parvum]|nr:acyltransferase family protein [Treponema parvum]QTQ16753.1 acyltransferase family protein [Treponema parvum]